MKVIHKPGPGGATLEGVVEGLRGIEGVRGKVGWFEGNNYPNGTPVALVAATQEFGYPEGGIPPRPMMRPTIAQEQGVWTKGFADGYRAVLRGKATPENVMEQVAGHAAGSVRKTISEIFTPPLKRATIERRLAKKGKGAEPGPALGKPLVDTGRLISTVTHQVEKTK